jgi:excisionase family DNA binding protein
MGTGKHVTARNLAGLTDNTEDDHEPPPPFRSHDLARRWGVPEQTICALLRSGRLRGFRLKRQWLIPRANVEAYEKGDAAA